MSTLTVDVQQNGSVKNVDSSSVHELDEYDFFKAAGSAQKFEFGEKRSFDERSLTELPLGFSPHPPSRADNFYRAFDVLDSFFSPGRRSGLSTPKSLFGYGPSNEPHPMVAEAWDNLRRSLVYFRGQPVGTIAALDNSEENLNYDQVKGNNSVSYFASLSSGLVTLVMVFVRDFVPSALAFLMNGEPEIVKNFILKTLRLQSWEKRIDRFQLGEGVMPASFKVLHDPTRNTETLIADFGESAIGRVAPVDSGFWWIILLRAYTKSTGDTSLAERPECQKGMRLILSLCLSEGFDTFPTLLCADGCSMIDRRMVSALFYTTLPYQNINSYARGSDACLFHVLLLFLPSTLSSYYIVYGYPIEIQALFFMALRCALLLLKQDGPGKEFIERVIKRLHALSYHMRSYFWLDLKQLNDIYRYKTEEYSHTAVNKFNVMPDSLPEWVFDFMPLHGGYFIGNAMAIMDLIESRWEELVGDMPLKVSYPAIESHEWRIITGCDPKNTRWSYHNGGSWPAACIKTGRPQIARRAIELAETRLSKDGWPEYYDGKLGRYIGKQARKHQTWSIAGYLVAKMMLEDPSHLGMVAIEEDKQMKPVLKRSSSF
ncbi:putative alkaline/neutral invertase B [Sesamum angolense]|uniref:Alkaline/neutral invertase n=1 Tax=Sesamum angolense TaxID=2727404 RepID=A0AAE1WXX9_9LAMI|nr:putative alkaline/neutral invertase B [Sesamum angolense]